MMLKHFLRFLNESLHFFREIPVNSIRANDSAIGEYLRRRLFRTHCKIDTNVFIKNKNNFTAGKNSCLYHGCYILNTNGEFSIGNNSHLGAFCYVNVCYGSIKMGDDVAVGPGTKIIVYSNYYKFGKKVTQEKLCENIIIGSNVFIGANCVILPGVIIHDNAIIGAGSVVKGEIGNNSVYAGIPANKLKDGWYK